MTSQFIPLLTDFVGKYNRFSLKWSWLIPSQFTKNKIKTRIHFYSSIYKVQILCFQVTMTFSFQRHWVSESVLNKSENKNIHTLKSTERLNTLTMQWIFFHSFQCAEIFLVSWSVLGAKFGKIHQIYYQSTSRLKQLSNYSDGNRFCLWKNEAILVKSSEVCMLLSAHSS